MIYSNLISRKGIIVLFVLFVGFISSSSATPPQMPPTWDDPVIAYVIFPVSHYPDEQGRFEVEVFYEVVYDVEELTLSVGFTEEITFDKDPPHFEGSLKKGESKVWRIKGTVNAVPAIDDLGMPAAINLFIKYRFPYEAVLMELKKRNDQDVPYAMQELEKVKDKIKTIMRALPVEILEPAETK